VLTLTAAAGNGTAEATATPAATEEDAEHGHAAAVEESPGGLALFVAILALLTAIGGVVLGWRANRRTVSS
jgi:hypothetical protein